MIKINLLKSFGASSSETLQQLSEQKNVEKVFLKKLFVMFLGVLGLVLVEQYHVPKLISQRDSMQSQHNELITFNQKKEELKVEIEKYEQDRVRLNRQTEFLQKIQRERILSIDFLNKIQELIPSGVWLTSLKIDGENIEIKGDADSEKEINEFNLKLSTVGFLKDVLVLSIDLKPPDPVISIPIKSFSMKAMYANNQLNPTSFQPGQGNTQ